MERRGERRKENRPERPPRRTAESSRSAAPVEGLPPAVSGAIVEYIEKKTGKKWGDESLFERLSRAIVAQKSEYWKAGRKRVSYGKGYQVLGYLAYHFPVYYAQGIYLMHELEERGLVFPSMRVLDVGAGPGTVALAIAEYAGRRGDFTAEIFPVEKSEEFIEAYSFLAGRLSPPGGPVTLREPLKADILSIGRGDLPRDLDLVVFQNVLNEITTLTPSEKGKLVADFAAALSGRGSVLVVEPADLDNSLSLRAVARSAAGFGLFIHAPCRFLWGQACTSDRCWSFVQKPPIRPPPFMQDLAEGKEGYRFLNVDIKYSFALLRKDPPPPTLGIPLTARKYVRLAALARHVNRRVRVAATVVSGDIGDRENHVFAVCDGSSGIPVYAILPRYHVSERNRWLLSARYGEIAEFSSVLVRFNPKYAAYNLLVTRESNARPFLAAGREESGEGEIFAGGK
ncbi:MAG: hypothetical protein QFX32_02955 [Methanolinea sp.]|nr:hypothetical protein [Methanolinea sp.]